MGDILKRKFSTVVFYIPTLLGGGAERVFVNLCNFFTDNGINTILVTSYHEGYVSQLNEKVNVVYILRKRIFNNKYLHAIHRISFSLIVLSKTILKHKQVILITTLDEANVIGFISSLLMNNQTKHIARQASVFSKSKINLLKRVLLKFAFNNADLIVANSPDTKKSLQNFSENLIDKIHVIGNPIFSKKIESLNKELSYGTTERKFLLTVGRLVKEKDHKTLIKAFQIIRNKFDIELLIIGEGPQRMELENEIKTLQLSDSVFLMGFIENPYYYYKNASVFVLSSISEGFGNVIVEALSFGKPVVSTNCPGGPNYILNNGEFGLLCPVGNYKLLADSIISILNDSHRFDPELLTNRAKFFSLDNIGSKYIGLLNYFV